MASLTPLGATTTLAHPAMATTTATTETGPARAGTVAVDVRGGAHVEVRSLTKTFLHGGRLIEVLRGLDFELGPARWPRSSARRGSGSRRCLQVLGTLDAPTGGTISFDGVDVTSMSQARLAEFRNREIGFVFQFHHLLPEFTALENVMMPGLILRLSRAEARRARRAMLAPGGPRASGCTHRPGELSGGEQQRVALARALRAAAAPAARRRADGQPRHQDGRARCTSSSSSSIASSG